MARGPFEYSKLQEQKIQTNKRVLMNSVFSSGEHKL